MANSSFQIATTPKLYVSYPLFQYANGALDSYTTDKGSFSDDNIIKPLQIDPSNQITFPDDVYNYEKFFYKVLPSFDDSNPVDSGLWNFDFYMILGHNFASIGSGHNVNIKAYKDTTYKGQLDITNIVNDCANGVQCEFDGWSLGQINDIPDDANTFSFHFNTNTTGYDFNDVKIGSLLFGRSYSFPQNCQMNTSTVFEYGVKQKSTISGKTISTANWTKPNNWGTEPFGLTSEGQEGDNFQRRTGRRVWKMTFDSLAPDKVFPQNMMMNDNNYTPQDNHTQGAAENSSLYNINNSEDFYSSVVHKTLGGHLPMVLQLDQNDTSPSNFAIVRMNKDFKVQQKSPLLYTYSITLTEQI